MSKMNGTPARLNSIVIDGIQATGEDDTSQTPVSSDSDRGTQPIMGLGIALKEELPHKLVCEDGLELGNSICDQERMLQILS